MSYQRSLCLVRFGLASIAAAALFNLSGCSSGPYSAGRDRTPDERRAAFPIVSDDWAKLGYRIDWTGFPAVTGSLPVEFIQAYPDVVVTLEAGSQLSVLEATTGNRRTTNQLANPLTKFVGLARDGDRILACSQSEVFSVDNRTGVLLDRRATEKIVATEPVQFGNLLIFGTPAGEVLAHFATGNVGGVKVWGFGTGASVERKPALIGTTVGSVSQNGQVVFLDAATGSLVGRNSIFAGTDTDPVSDGNAMYVASLDQSIYAFAPHGGSQLWRYRTPSPLRTQPTAHAGSLYCSIPGQGLVAFDVTNGTVRWTCKTFTNGVVVAVNHGDLVVFNGEEGALIDAQRGDVIKRVKLPGVAMLKPDAFVDGNLYAVSKSGVVAKFLKR